MSVAFLECQTFLDEFPEWKGLCCAHCHSEPINRLNKIYVHPLMESGEMVDWFLCLEGVVCCGLYHRVRTLPREWWVAKSIALGVRREDGRGYVYVDSPEHNTERPHVVENTRFKKEKAKQEVVKARAAEEAGGLRSWLK